MGDGELFGRDDRNEVIDRPANEVRTPRVREVPDRDHDRSVRSALRFANDLVPRGFIAVLEIAHADVADVGVDDHALIVREVTASYCSGARRRFVACLSRRRRPPGP